MTLSVAGSAMAIGQEGRNNNDDDDDDDDDDDPDDDDFDEFPFTNLKNEVCQLFTKIPLPDFTQRVQFLDNNRELLAKNAVNTIEAEFFKQSVDFSRMGKNAATMSCIFSLALLRVSKSQKQLSPFFRMLLLQQSAEKQGYNDVVRLLNTLVEQKAQQEGPLSPPQRKPMRRKSARSDIATLRISDLFQQGLSKDSEYYIGAADVTDEKSIPKTLSPGYKVRRNAKDFFVPGKVFAILWTEATNKKMPKKMATEDLLKPRRDESLSVVRYGETVFTHVRRMVVVRSRKGYSWCVSIGTYGGQGLGKPGLKPEDIADHTVIYDIDKKVVFLDDEPRSARRPIGVQMVKGETLDPASRIHLGKPFNVEWNVKVMDVGQVVPKDLPALLLYVKQVMGL